MALTSVHCQSCGGNPQIDPELPGDGQTCPLCGQPPGGSGEDFAIPSTEKEEATAGPYVPSLRQAGTCPHCFTEVLIDTARELKKQRCHSCGHKLIKKRRNNQGHKADAPGAEAALFRRERERVWLPIAGVTLAVVFAATWVLWLVLRPETKNAAAVKPALPAEPELIRGLITRFAAAHSVEEVLPLVRDPEKNVPAVKMWFAAHPGPIAPGGGFAGIVSRRVALGTNLCQVAVSGREEPVLLAETNDGWRVEWRAFTGDGDMSVAEFLEKHPSEPALVLAAVQRSTYYNEPYASSNVWQSLYVAGKKGEDGFYAYAPRNNAAVMSLLTGLPDSVRDGRNLIQTSRRLALRLRFTSPEAVKAGMAEVVSIEGDGWFIP